MVQRVLLSACLLVLAACSHGTGGTTADAIERVPALPLESLADPQAVGAARLDLATLQSAPLYANVRDWIDLLLEEGDSADSRFLRATLRAEQILAYLVVPEAGEPHGVLLLRGRFSTDDALAFAQQSESPQTHTRGPFVVYEEGEQGAIVMLGNHTIALGHRVDVDAVCDRQLAGGNGGLPSSSAFARLASRVDFGNRPIAFAVVPNDRMRSEASGESDQLLSTIASSQGLALGLDLREGLQGKAIVDLDSGLAAMGLVTIARAQLNRLPNDEDVAATGLGELFRYLQLDREDSSIVATLDAPTDATSRAFQAFSRFLRERSAQP